MNALTLAALSVMVGAFACDSTATAPSTPASESDRSTTLGADPGGILPSVCLGKEDLRAWQRIAPDAVGGRVPENWRGSDCSWSVMMQDEIPIVFATPRNENARLDFIPPDTSERPSAVARSASGALVGFNRGEWGGELVGYPKNGRHGSVLLDNNVVSILPAFGQFIALTYLGHGSRPRALAVRDTGHGFEVGRVVDLPGVPTAAALRSDGSVLIAAGHTLLALSRALELHELQRNLVQSPHSIALGPSGIIYLGMYGIVVELRTSTTPPTETWLYPF